tara:strand:+ start:522 stop:2522 length:2001 start_codon:yes stop_codon:yes gene_type:complete
MTNENNNNNNNNNANADQIAQLNRLLKEQADLQNRSNNAHRDRLNLQAKLNGDLKAYLDLKREQQALQKAGIDLSEADQQALESFHNEIDEATKKLIELAEAQDKLNQRTKAVSDGIREFTGANVDFIKQIKINEEGVTDYSDAFAELGKSITKGTRSAAKGLDALNISLAKQTGFTTALRQDVYDLADSQNGLFLSLSESEKVVGSLSVGFKMYAALSKTARAETNALAGRFSKLGVDAGAFSEALDQLNEGFGLTRSGALAAMAEFENLAIRTGQPLSAVVNDFKDLGPQMARFGTDGVRVFTKLNQQARTLGLTTRQAFDISELFDTFEGSADVAGKLNAQLGLQVNSVELMAASSEERLKILRAEFDMRGIHMKDMGRRQKQMVAEILKTDVLTAERLLGDPMEMRKFQREQANNQDRIQKYTTAVDKFSEAWEQLFINISPWLNGMIETFGAIAEAINWLIASPLGKMASYVIVMAGAAMRFAKMLGVAGSFMSKLAWFAKKILIPFLIIKDVLQAMGFMADDKEQWAAQKRLMAGTAAGASTAAVAGAAGLAGGPLAFLTGAGGFMAGYGVGREIPELVQDKTLPSGQPTLIARAGQRPIITSHMDTVTASKGSSAGSLERKFDKLSNAVLALANRPVQATMEVDGEKLGKVVLQGASPA